LSFPEYEEVVVHIAPRRRRSLSGESGLALTYVKQSKQNRDEDQAAKLVCVCPLECGHSCIKALSIAIFFGVELRLEKLLKLLRPKSRSDWSVKIF